MKVKAFIFNVIIAVVCVASVLAYHFVPFLTLDLSVTTTKDLLEKIWVVDESGTKEGNIANDVIKALGEDPVKVSVVLDFNAEDIVKASIGKDENAVETIVTKNAEKLVNKFVEDSEDLVNAISKAGVKATVNAQIKDAIAKAGSQETLENVFYNAGVTDEFINGKIDEFIDTFTKEDSSLDEIKEKAVAICEEVHNKVKNSGAVVDMGNFNQDDVEDITTAIEKVFGKIAKEDGSIDSDTILAELMISFLDGNEKISLTSDSEDTKELQVRLKDSLMSKLSKDGLNEKLLKIIKIIGYVILGVLATWVWIVVKMILKVFLKNPCVKLWLPIVFGWLPFIVLVLIPLLIGIPQIQDILVSKSDLLGSLFNSVTIATRSCSLISAVGAGVLIILSIPYGILRKKFKKAKK